MVFSTLFPYPLLYLCRNISYSGKNEKKEEDDDNNRESQLFEDDLAHSRTRAEAIGEEIVRREGGETFVKYTNIDVTSFLEAHVQGPDAAAGKEKQPKVITVSTALARSIRNRLWQSAVNVAIKIAESPEDEEEEKRGILGSIFHYIVVIPWNVARNMSIPPSSEDNWSRIRASFFPIPAYLLIVLFFEGARPTDRKKALIFVGIILVAMFLSLVIYFSTHVRRAPNSLVIFTFLSFVFSIIWIWGWANLLIDLLELIGIVANLPLEFLGLTFLAFGNAMPDIATNIAIAKMGLSEMALTGCVSEPVFSMLVGLGSSMIRGALTYGAIPFNLKRKQAKLPFVGLCIVLATQFIFLVYNCRNKFKMTKSVSFIQLFIYAFFFGIIVTLTCILPENDRE